MTNKEQLPGTHDFLGGDGNAVPAVAPPVLEEPMADIVPEQFADFALDPNDPLSQELAAQAKPQQTAQPQQIASPETQQTTDEQRYQYWQSQYDKERNENMRLQQETQRINPYLPLIDAIEKNPNLLDALETASQGEKIEAPVQPQPPADYNLEEASESGTESYKYRNDLENWRNKTIQYQNSLIENMMTQQREERQTTQQRQQESVAKQELKNNLVAQYDLPVDIADQFIREMSAPQSKNESNLIRLFYLNHPELRQQMLPTIQRLNVGNQPMGSPNQQYMNPNLINTPQGQQQLAQRINQMQNQQIPPSVVLGQGANPPQLNEEQKFNQGLLQTQEVDF